MPKPKHESPHAERQIDFYDLPRWRSTRDVEREALEREHAEQRRLELVAVDWESLSPAELAFRWFLDRRESDGTYRRWAADVLAAWEAENVVWFHGYEGGKAVWKTERPPREAQENPRFERGHSAL